MKNNLLTAILLGLLAVSALASVGLCYLYIANMSEMRTLQISVNNIQARRNLFNLLVTDMMEYRKTNPAIGPLIDAVIKPQKGAAPGMPTAPATSAAPVSRPGTR